MNTKEWLEATKLSDHTISIKEREERFQIRAKALKRADTTLESLRACLSRGGRVGIETARKLSEATKNDKYKVLVIDEFDLRDELSRLD